MSCPRTVCRACGLPPEDMRMIPNSPLRRQIDSLYIGVENAIWAKKPCREAKDSFHGLKRKSATMHSQTWMVGLHNFHGSASQLPWFGFCVPIHWLKKRLFESIFLHLGRLRARSAQGSDPTARPAGWACYTRRIFGIIMRNERNCRHACRDESD